MVTLSLVTIINCAEFRNCPKDANYGKLNDIIVANCGVNDVRCPFKSEHNTSMKLVFETNQEFENAKIKIIGILTGLRVPFKITPDQACDYGAVCPLKANQNNTINLEFPIKRTYPKIKLEVEVSLESSSGELIVCVQFPAQIVP